MQKLARRDLVHRTCARAVQTVLRRPSGSDDSAICVRILVQNAYVAGGIVRSTFNLAEHLSGRYDVEVVSLHRREGDPFLPIHGDVDVSTIADDRHGGNLPRNRWRRLLARFPSLLIHPDASGYQWLSLLEDILLLKRVRDMKSGVLISTRPGFSTFAARFAPRGLTVIAHEHLAWARYTPELRAELRRRYPSLDAVVVLTPHAEREYEWVASSSTTRLARIPNALPKLDGSPREQRQKMIVAAGRLSREKGFDLLISSFAKIAARHPDWKLHIYGDGDERASLQQQIEALGLSAAVVLSPATGDLGRIMAECAVFALSSRAEALPLVLLEAMSKGMAVVSFDSAAGPRDVIDHGANGLLVAAEDVNAFADALEEVMTHEQRRRELGRQAMVTAATYDPVSIGRRWEELLQEVGRQSADAAAPRRKMRWR